jgi:hypothetical protein
MAWGWGRIMGNKNIKNKIIKWKKKNDQNNHSALVPVKYYPNLETYKAQILSENKQKSGIYMFTNLFNAKQYIGSAIDLSNRLKLYYSNLSMVNKLKKSQSYI